MGVIIENGDIFVVRAWTTSAEQAAVNSFYYRNISAAGTPASDQDVASAMDTLLAPLYKAVLADTDTYNGVQVQIVDPFTPGPLNMAVNSIAAAGPGTIAGNVLPRQSCGITTWTTAFAGRKYRGRSYWPFPPVTLDAGEGLPTNAAVALYQALAGNILAFTFIPGFSNTFNMVLFHRNFPHATPPILPTADDITDYATHKKWATQRRRGSYGRANVSPI